MKKEYKKSVGFGQAYNGISVELGRKKEIKDATGKKALIQNINVSYKGTPIINQDYKMKNMVVQIFPDINEAVVGNIFLPEEIRGKKLIKYIYQAVTDKLNIPLVNSLDRKDRLGIYYNQSKAGSRIWKKRKSFTPQSKQENKSKNSLENKLVPGLFILSFFAGLFLISPNLTGNVVGNSNVLMSNISGVVLILLGIIGFFIYNKYHKKK